MKGLVYRGAQEFLETRVPGGRGLLLEALREASLRAFVSQPFVTGGWYDVLPIVPMSRAAAQVAGTPHLQYVRENAAWLARRDIHGVYRALLKLASVELVVSRLPRASIQYFDFGTAAGKLHGPADYHATQHGVPEPIATWLIACVEGFVPVALKTAGARTVEVERRSIVRVGTGTATVDITYSIRWT